MKIFHELREFKTPQKSAFLTIGMFDGVHRGHQSILKKITEEAQGQRGQSIVITFKNHPSAILKPHLNVPLIMTPEHRLRLLENHGIETVFMLSFTKEFSEQSAEFFLKKLSHFIPLKKIVLGYDAVLGKDRQGDRSKIQDLAKSLHFEVDYLPECVSEKTTISSSTIRSLIKEGDLFTVEKLLGRRYSIFSTVVKGKGKGKALGFPTANIDVQGLSLPPLGVYAIKGIVEEKLFEGIANLGVAPTLKNDPFPTLEVHLFDKKDDFYGKPIEVIFFDYLRPELKFINISQLQMQIKNDIQQAKNLLI